ncbi:hypothetical protein [Mobiluncus mulieris]|uniref:hypothetical protein n=1 Tax=Mobiluncus mulieris TaxID=2052 RepID=UPI00147027A2|nr:hypothetical protein [Mobiluncus mulieris]NMW74980.1 hypothetical protein [Mobiluncus mulieris]NMX12075.1 hypothetical protein [Mobiluncus mulieris]
MSAFSISPGHGDLVQIRMAPHEPEPTATPHDCPDPAPHEPHHDGHNHSGTS